MRTKMFLAAMCLSLAVCTQAFSGESQFSGCRKHAFRGWLKAVTTVQCKTCIFCQNPPAPEPAPTDAPKDAPKQTLLPRNRLLPSSQGQQQGSDPNLNPL